MLDKKVNLCYSNGKFDGKQAASLIFGELVKLATEQVKCYHSDLYHDALSVKMICDAYDKTQQPPIFYYSAGRHGTHLQALPSWHNSYGDNDHYEISVYVEDGDTIMRIRQVSQEDLKSIWETNKDNMDNLMKSLFGEK